MDAPHAPAVVCLTADIFFMPRLADAIAQQGGAPVFAEDAEALVDAVDRTFPVLVLVDLQAAGDWAGAIQRIKNRPHSRRIPVYAYGPHVQPDALRAARAAGADHAWARSRMMKELVDVIARYLQAPVRYVDGWDDHLSGDAERGVAAFNRGEYYRQHDYFEAAWREETRPVRDLYQGILQVGVAFYLLEQDNWAGAVKMIRRGLSHLRGLPAVCQGIDLAAFRAHTEAAQRTIMELGPARTQEVDPAAYPRIELVADWPPEA